MLTLAGDANAAVFTAKAIVAFETELAKLQWTKVELRDPVKAYNKVDIAKLGEAGAWLRLERLSGWTPASPARSAT
jgi:predicted metalloendopeptidase